VLQLLQVHLRGKRLAFLFISLIGTTDALQRVVFDRRRFDESSALGFPTKGPLCPCDLLTRKRQERDERKIR
jgi:hypothetical protein